VSVSHSYSRIKSENPYKIEKNHKIFFLPIKEENQMKNNLLVGAAVSSVLVSITSALIILNQRKKATAEETEVGTIGFGKVLQMRKEAETAENPILTEEEISAINAVDAQIGDTDQQSEPADPADLVEKPKRKMAAPKKETVEQTESAE
jgi:hypothetical protein